MKQRESAYVDLYNAMWNLYSDWTHTAEGDLSWTEERYLQYKYGPVIGMYKERDPRLFSFLCDNYSDDCIIDIVVLDKKRQLQKLQSNANRDPFDVWRQERFQRELVLLKDRKLDCWIDEFFLPMLEDIELIIEPLYVKGFCFIYYDYADFYAHIVSPFNQDVSNLKKYTPTFITKNRSFTHIS